MRRAGRPLVVIAIVADAVALALLGVAVGQTLFIGFFMSLLVDAIAVPIAVFAAVLSTVAIVRGARRRRRLVTVAAVALALGALPIGLVALGVASSFTAELSPNPARDAVRAVGASIESNGGHRVCSAGDPGFGPDNVQPWYVGIYDAPAGSGLRARLADRATALGIDVLSTSTETDATRTAVVITTDTAGLEDLCGGRTPTAAAGRQLIRIDGTAPPRS